MTGLELVPDAAEKPMIEPRGYRVLALDGGGIKGVFSASILAEFEASLGEPLVEYFDLIVGTSTGGIIALGLALGVPAKEILRFYELQGPSIFGEKNGLLSWFGRAKYDSAALAAALQDVFGDRLLGEATTRVVVPSTTLETGDVYVFKTAHHERFVRDYKERVTDVALATAAAPTYFRTHRLPADIPLIDGGIWANNPMGVAAVEAVGLLEWPRGSVKLLSLSCTESPVSMTDTSRRGLGLSGWGRHLVDHFMAAQSSAAHGTAQLLLGHENVHRISKTVPTSRYKLDNVKEIGSLKGLGSAVARQEFPKVQAMFLSGKAEQFVPVRGVSK